LAAAVFAAKACIVGGAFGAGWRNHRNILPKLE
jgi:hypothetical protein